MSLNEDINMEKSFFYKSVGSVMAIIKQKEAWEKIKNGPSLILVDNVGVATSSLNALAFAKTVIERLLPVKSVNTTLTVVATSQPDLIAYLPP